MEESAQLRLLQHYFQLLHRHIAGEDEEEDEKSSGLVSIEEVSNRLDSLLSHPLAHELAYRTGCHTSKPDQSLFAMLNKRERMGSFRAKDKIHLAQRLIPGEGSAPTTISDESDEQKPSKLRKSLRSSTSIPQNKSKLLDEYDNQVFCGRFSRDGTRFMSACQDRHIRIYDADLWKVKKDIIARDVGWSIIDTDFSPDQRFLIYSSWSDYIHLCGVADESEETHESLDLKPQSHRFCLFSVQFSHTSNEILAGSSDKCLYIYDLDRGERTLRLKAHKDDINSVAWADETSQLLFSGADDTLIKIWDRRQLKDGKPVGVMQGHLEGITHVCSKGDGRYLISNSKDQSIKLWDLRAMTDPTEAENHPRCSTGWDYRRGAYDSALGRTQAKVFSGELAHPNDTSLKTYRGHKVFQTLIRAYFSPEATTGQKYIYCGSYDGTVHIYDLLTGETVAQLDGHDATVRDVSWHPHYPSLVSTSWDGTVRLWDIHGANAKKWSGDYPDDEEQD